MSQPSHEQIEVRAYQLWEERGHPWGSPEVDWFRAERELTEASKNDRIRELAREVGAGLGTAVAFVSSRLGHDNAPPE